MEFIRIFLRIIEILIYLYLMLASVYILVFAIAGRLYKQKIFPKARRYRKFAVLIPGYKEDKVIINTAEDALKQNYPKEKFDVIVIADSFQPQTLEKLRSLPIKVIEVSFEISKKSKALNECMKIIDEDYDIAFVLDADNLMGQDVLTKINDAFDYGNNAVQVHRTAKNLDSNFAILDALSEEINNNIFRKGHRFLGLSSALIGSGIAIDYKLYKKTMATIDSIGEDKELELKIIKKKNEIEYITDAIVLDEKTKKPNVFVNQRRRWIAAQNYYFKSYFADGIKMLIKKGDADYFYKVIQMIQPPRILLNGALFILSVIYGIIYLVPVYTLKPYFFPNFIAWVIPFICTSAALIISVPRKFYNKKVFKALFLLPYGFILMFLSLLRIRGASKKFIHTEHS